MTRSISGEHPARIEQLAAPSGGIATWLEDVALRYGLRWLLLHADDGVLWGVVSDGRLHLAHEVAPDLAPPLRDATVWMARVFAPQAEVFLWRSDGDWRARLIHDTEPGEEARFQESIDERQILWGTSAIPLEGSPFMRVRHGAQGMEYVVPRSNGSTEVSRSIQLTLAIRQYIEEDEMGFARVSLSRLVALEERVSG